MAFIETPRFPDAVSFGAQGGPEFETDVIVTSGGDEFRNQNWSQARRRYDVSHAARTPALYDSLLAFFHVTGGKARAFRFKDWSDFQVADGAGFFSPIDSTHFQLVKRYSSGDDIHDRFITKPVSGTITVSGTGSYTVDYTTGIVTKASGADPDAWGGQFDVPCRFDTDSMQGAIKDKSGSDFVQGWDSIAIVEVRDIA